MDTQHPERLKKQEITARSRSEQQPAAAPLELTHVTATHTKRTDMLASIAKIITPALREKLAAKIEYEKETLLGFLEHEAHAQAVEQKRAKMLDDRYFTKKSLNLANR